METPEGVAGLVVEGYVACRCGQWMVDPGDDLSIRLCPECRENLRRRATEGRLRYEVEGRSFTAAPKRRKPPKKGKTQLAKNLTADQRDRRRRVDRAKMRSYVRLARIYRPMYELILAEEKLREGLDPSFKSTIPRPRAIEAELLRDLAEAEERDRVRGEMARSEA